MLRSSCVRPAPAGAGALPYHDDVQYPDLASLFRAWAGHPVGGLDGDVAATGNGGDNEYARFE